MEPIRTVPNTSHTPSPKSHIDYGILQRAGRAIKNGVSWIYSSVISALYTIYWKLFGSCEASETTLDICRSAVEDLDVTTDWHAISAKNTSSSKIRNLRVDLGDQIDILSEAIDSKEALSVLRSIPTNLYPSPKILDEQNRAIKHLAQLTNTKQTEKRIKQAAANALVYIYILRNTASLQFAYSQLHFHSAAHTYTTTQLKNSVSICKEFAAKKAYSPSENYPQKFNRTLYIKHAKYVASWITDSHLYTHHKTKHGFWLNLYTTCSKTTTETLSNCKKGALSALTKQLISWENPQKQYELDNAQWKNIKQQQYLLLLYVHIASVSLKYRDPVQAVKQLRFSYDGNDKHFNGIVLAKALLLIIQEKEKQSNDDKQTSTDEDSICIMNHLTNEWSKASLSLISGLLHFFPGNISPKEFISSGPMSYLNHALKNKDTIAQCITFLKNKDHETNLLLEMLESRSDIDTK